MSENKFILVKGDVSGIQDFIFNVKSKGAAQELKGRSFFIKLLIEVAIRYLLDKAEVSMEERESLKISTSGGNFIIKLPVEKKDVVDKSQEVFTTALQFTGLNISIVEIDYDISNFSNSIINLNKKNRERKLQFYTKNNFFEPKYKNNYTSGGWNNITTRIKDSSHFSIESKESNDPILQIGKMEFAGYKVIFSQQGDFKIDNYLEGLFPLYKDNKNKEKIKLFSQGKHFEQSLCKSSKIAFQNKIPYVKFEHGGMPGVEKLGVLAMDVDGLGNIVESIDNEEEYEEFDKKLKLFFNDTISGIINDDNNIFKYPYRKNRTIDISKFKNKIYTVTAGGDDSFFVGKWNAILDLAIAINEAFTTTFKEKGLTISAGIVFVDPKFPVVRFAELAENALKKAKYAYDSKGNICLFNEVVKWDKIERINIIKELFNENNLSGGLLEKARHTAIEGLDNEVKLEDFWKMGYYLRNLKNKDKIYQEIVTDINKASLSQNKLEKRNYRLIMPIASRLAELEKRK